MKKAKFKIILALAALTMVSAAGLSTQSAYAEEADNTNVEISQAAQEADKDSTTLKVAVREGNMSMTINPVITLTNTSDEDIDLSRVTLHYYYTSDGDIEERFKCYCAYTIDGNFNMLTNAVKGEVVKLPEAEKTADADSYINIGFTEGTIEAGQSITLQVSVNKLNWMIYDKTNDYSYNNADHIGAFIDGCLVWGE